MIIFFIETKITGLVGGTGDVPVWKYRGWGGVRWRNISFFSTHPRRPCDVKPPRAPLVRIYFRKVICRFYQIFIRGGSSESSLVPCSAQFIIFLFVPSPARQMWQNVKKYKLKGDLKTNIK